MEDTRSRWERAFAESLDHDAWGQVEEAVEGYQRLQIATAAEYMENVLQLSMPRRENIGKLAAVLKIRMQELHSTEKGLGLNSMKKIKPYMKEMIITDATFPLANIDAEAVLGLVATAEVETEVEVDQDVRLEDRAQGTLRPPPKFMPGDISLTCWIEKWGFKDATGFVEPRVLISIRNLDGEPLGALQETPVCVQRTHNYCHFDSTVYIQMSLNQLPKGTAVFFEFRHWKARKHKKSTWAYCFMEMDEIKSGPITLEVYKKPADYSRKLTPSLLTVKPLYMHLDLAVKRI